MKIPQEYGGLGLSMLHYGRALMLVGSVHPSMGALVSAHQSIGVPEPVKMFGTEEQKQAFLPRCAAGAITAFLLTEPDVGSDPARLASTATLTEDGTAYLLDGVKLWTTNGVIAELVVVMATVPAHDGGRGGITAFVVEADSAGHHRGEPQRVHGPEGHRERRDPVPPGAGAGGEPAGPRGGGPQDRPDHAQHRPAVDPGDVRRRRQVVPEDRPRVVAASGCSGASRSASTRRWRRRSRSSPPRRSRSRRCFELSGAARRRRHQGHPDRGRARQAVVQRDGVSDRRRAGPDPRRPRVRDRRLAGRPRRAGRARRAGPARPADQPDLRGLLGDHAPADRPGGRRRAPGRGRRPGVARRRPAGQGEGGGARPAVSTRSGCRSWSPARAPTPTSYDEFGALAKHLRYVERSSRKLARQTFYGMGRWQAKMEYQQAFLGRVVDIGAELFAMAAACVPGGDAASGGPGRRQVGVPARRRVLRPGAAPGRGVVRRVVGQHRCCWTAGSPAGSSTATTPGSRSGVVDGSEGTGPWISAWQPGESAHENVHRPYR